mmetsp:Transcript_23200/g.30971  ORF Transcript_23200/g.30971 Transcript_23200/m.30971 type:complete len:263 (-) Transcript_23200:85-873(-)
MNTKIFTLAALGLCFTEFAHAKDLPKITDVDDADFDVASDADASAEPMADGDDTMDKETQEDILDVTMTKQEMMDRSLMYFDGLRGMWIGFHRGLYRDAPRKEMEEECLNSEQRARWEEAYSIYLGTEDVPENADTFTALGDILQLLANLNSCNLRKPYRDLKTFCFVEDESADADKDAEKKDDDKPEFDDLDDDKQAKCSFSMVLENFSKNAFVLMGKGSSMAQTMKEFPADNPDELMVQSMTLGEDFGTFLKVGIDFEEP